jgi:8-hydroxy-5-deazaflavin:NADPH oxidoreductase
MIVGMRIGIIGAGNVGGTIAEGAERAGHEVRLGARSPKEEQVPIAEAAEFGELIVNATEGDGSLEALNTAGAENLAGKTMLDIANAGRSVEGGFELTYVNDNSLAEEIQRAFPDLRVVKGLNTMTRHLMAEPGKLAGDHTALICGNDDAAKGEVRSLLESFGWKPDNILDLGDLTAARALEMIVPLWARLYSALGSEMFQIAVVRP